MVDMLWPRVEHGDIRPTIHAVFPIQDAEEAHRVMREGRNVGKPVSYTHLDVYKRQGILGRARRCPP